MVVFKEQLGKPSFSRTFIEMHLAGVIDEFETDPAYEGDSLPANWFSWQKLWRYTGPGFLMSIAYLVWLRATNS